jgi:TolB-like protein/tetratricopeptide (TPR) repeat protein/predicted Ser/Thr protein kinase
MSLRLSPGSMLGSYRVERLLGLGGMGAVYLAYDTTLHRQVALKVIGGEGDEEASRARLLREARNAAALNHPNICTIHEVGLADGTAYIAMEYVDGASLRDRIDSGGVSIDEALRCGIQAADALAYAHQCGVVHRDFKAANIIVGSGGRLKIVDFGLARRIDALLTGATTMATVVPAGAAAGTPYAMAPEQIRGEATDARTDVWALGVLLHELACGTRPFNAPLPADIFSAILRDPPAAAPARVPIPLRTIIERCLEKNAPRRYQNARDVREALEAVQAGTVPRGQVWAYRLRRRRALAAAAAFVAAVAGTIALNPAGVRDRFFGAPAPMKLVVLPFKNLTGDPDQEFFSDGLTEEMISQLGRLQPSRLSVVARTSTMQYKNRTAPVDQIGRELGVDYVLEGSARREGSRVRINATLIGVRDQTQRWTDSFERELSGILALQSDVARGVAGSLALTLLPEERARLGGERAVNPKAYEAYLKGREHWYKQTPGELDTALQYFQIALEDDPAYAAAWAGVALVWIARNQMAYVSAGEATPRAREAASKAIALDAASPVAHYALATVAWDEWEWTTAEQESRRAIELDPNYPDPRAAYSVLLMALKRPEADALAQIRRAMELDPLNAFFRAFHSQVLDWYGHRDAAVAEMRRALQSAPDLPFAHCNLWQMLRAQRRDDEAIAEARQCYAQYGQQVVNAFTQGQREAGYRGAMKRAADALVQVRDTFVGPVDVALLSIDAGDVERALEWISKAVDARDPNVVMLLRNPAAPNGLRQDPRFQALTKRTRLPQ